MPAILLACFGVEKEASPPSSREGRFFAGSPFTWLLILENVSVKELYFLALGTVENRNFGAFLFVFFPLNTVAV